MRDFGKYDLFIEHSGVEYPYVIAEDQQSGFLLYQPTLVPETSAQQHTGNFSYDALPVELTNPVYFDLWALGAGFVDAPANTVTFDGYGYSRGVDASWGNRLYLSPKKTPLGTLGAAVTGTYFSPSFGFYAIAGRYLYQLQAGAFVQVHDAGAGKTLTDIVEYGNSVDTYLFLATGDSENIRYSTDGTTFTSTVAGVTGSFFSVRGQTTVEPVLWLIKVNGRIANSIEPTTAIEWSFDDQIGLTSEIVTGLVVADTLLYILKEEGVYTFNGVDVGHLLSLRQIAQTGNGGKHYVDVNGFVFTNYGNRLLRHDPVGLKTGVAFTSYHPELNGQIQGISGNTLHTFFALKNAAGGAYLMKGGGDAWHSIAYLGAANVGAIEVLPPGVIHATNPVVLVGVGADVSYYVLPREGHFPDNDGNCTFELTGDIYGSRIDAGVATMWKEMNGLRVVVQNVDITRTVTVAISCDEAAEEELAVVVTDGLAETRLPSSLSFTQFFYHVILSTEVESESPRVFSMMFDNTPFPPRRRAWAIVLAVEDSHLARGGGDGDYYGYRRLERHLFAAANQQVRFTDITGSEYLAKVLSVTGQGVSRKSIGRGRTLASNIRVELAEISSLTFADSLIWDVGDWDTDDWTES